MAELFTHGTIAVWILGFMILEAGVLMALRARTQLRVPDLAGMLGAGAALVMALRTALRGDSWLLTAFWLLVALAAHLFDLGRRLTGQRRLQAGKP